MSKYKLSERACLMRLSVGLPGKNRQDKGLSETVKSEHALGRNAGRWVKQKYPDWALEPIEKLVNEARAYHAQVTLPFDAGIGILPAALIAEYGDKMREFKGRFDHLRDSHFRAKYPEMVDWAKAEHNGTFDASDYPPADEVCESFTFRSEVQPVPGAEHFSETVKTLLGVDTESVDLRVNDAMQEAQRELVRRLIAPVRAVATKLQEQPKEGKDCPVFRDTLIGNLREIAGLAPKLNIAGDPAIAAFVKDIERLGSVEPQTLRESASNRAAVANEAEAVLKRLEGYAL